MAIILPFVKKVPVEAAMPDSTNTMGNPPDPQVPPNTEEGGGSDSGPLWAQLMEQAQDGDRGAYHALLKGIAPYLRSITHRYLGRGEDAEDAVQDVLMIVHGIRHTYERGRPFKPWLSTIATRRCIDLLRKRAQRLKHEIDASDVIDTHPNQVSGPEDTEATRQQVGMLRDAMAGLPQRQRAALRLLRLNELSLNEAAAQSDQSVGSLKVACHRAMKSLHALLLKQGSPHE